MFEASRLALIFKSKLVLIHVGEPSEDKTKTLQNILEPFLKQGLEYKIVFKTGNPVNVILNITQQEHIDLLIIGAAKRENMLKYYVGSIARQITRRAKCSLLLLIKPSLESVPCQNVIVNGLKANKTKQTIQTAFYVSDKLKSEKLTIVEEINQSEITIKVDDDESLIKANRLKEKIKKRENARIKDIIKSIPQHFTENIVLKLQPIFGTKGYSIGHYAQISRADLLVMNAPSKMTFIDRLFPHDIEHILTELPTDVLIVQ